jgi:hypothetical protein
LHPVRLAMDREPLEPPKRKPGPKGKHSPSCRAVYSFFEPGWLTADEGSAHIFHFTPCVTSAALRLFGQLPGAWSRRYWIVPEERK